MAFLLWQQGEAATGDRQGPGLAPGSRMLDPARCRGLVGSSETGSGLPFGNWSVPRSPLQPIGVRTNPEFIESEEALEEVLTHPRRELIEAIAEVRSPLVILGAGGKMGPSLAVLAKQGKERLMGPWASKKANRER